MKCKPTVDCFGISEVLFFRAEAVMIMEDATLGSYIRHLRTQNKMTQAALAEKLGVTDKAVSKWERNLSYPDMMLIPKLADTLGVTVSDLLGGHLNVKKPSRLNQIFGMTHDLRTPLHIMLNCASLAERHLDDPGLVKRYLESIRVSGEYLLNSVDHLMKVANQNQSGTGDGSRLSDIRELDENLKGSIRARKAAPDHSTEPVAAGSVGAFPGGSGKMISGAPGELSSGESEGVSPAKTGETFAEKAEVRKYDFTGIRVLIAEDMSINREIAADIMAQAGAESAFAEDGQICVEMVEAAPAGYYDLILMDIMMPNMDGLEATRRIRSLPDPKKAGIPIIAVSASVYESEYRAALEAGMNAFTEKPVFVDRLYEAVKQCLERKASHF